MSVDLSEKELSEFREIFNLVDADGSGQITQQELRSLMEVLRLRPTEEELYEMFTEAKGAVVGNKATGPSGGQTRAGKIGGGADGTSGGALLQAAAPASSSSSAGGATTSTAAGPTIDFDQFVAIMSKRVQSEYTPEQLRSAFQLFETEDAPLGTVTTEVLGHALMTYGTEKLSQEEAVRLLSAVDPDGTGLINYLDFVATVTGERK